MTTNREFRDMYQNKLASIARGFWSIDEVASKVKAIVDAELSRLDRIERERINEAIRDTQRLLAEAMEKSPSAWSTPQQKAEYFRAVYGQMPPKWSELEPEDVYVHNATGETACVDPNCDGSMHLNPPIGGRASRVQDHVDDIVGRPSRRTRSGDRLIPLPYPPSAVGVLKFDDGIAAYVPITCLCPLVPMHNRASHASIQTAAIEYLAHAMDDELRAKRIADSPPGTVPFMTARNQSELDTLRAKASLPPNTCGYCLCPMDNHLPGCIGAKRSKRVARSSEDPFAE